MECEFVIKDWSAWAPGVPAPADSADAWTWRLGAAVLSMAARAAPQSCFGDAGELDDAQAWRVRDRLTLP